MFEESKKPKKTLRLRSDGDDDDYSDSYPGEKLDLQSIHANGPLSPNLGGNQLGSPLSGETFITKVRPVRNNFRRI